MNYNLPDRYMKTILLGNSKGNISPINISENGNLMVENTRYELVKSITLDLSILRNKLLYEIDFDSFTVLMQNGSFLMYINDSIEDKKLTINQSLSASVSANKIFLSNTEQNSKAEIWFFKLKEA